MDPNAVAGAVPAAVPPAVPPAAAVPPVQQAGGNPAAQGAFTDMEQAVSWIGFNTNIQRNAIVAELGDDLVDIGNMTIKEMGELADSYAKRTVNDGRFIFGLQRTKRLRAFIHWVQDFRRTSEAPTTDGLTQDTFRAALNTSAERATIRKQEGESSDQISRNASPGKLKDERKWDEWITQLENMLSTINGVNNVPLSYVIRTDETADPTTTYATFVERCIARAPLTGAAYEADARQVHQLVVSLVNGEQSEQWIKAHLRQQNGRTDIESLRDHYEGEGNA